MTVAFQSRVARDLVVVEGPDATTFLQSLVSQDLDAIAVGASGHTLLLQPQGKLLVDFYVLRVGADEWWCVCEGGFGAELAAGLKRFKIRVKVELREETVAALAVRDVALSDTIASSPLPTTFTLSWSTGTAVLRSTRSVLKMQSRL
jgi:folate-binding Fe-S cluster repair protein YgfZ